MTGKDPATPPTQDLTIQQIDEELGNLHEQVTWALDRISLLRAQREDVIAAASDHLAGPTLAAAALTMKAAEQRLRTQTLAQHPWFVGLHSHPVGRQGQEYAWAPVVRLRAGRPGSEYQGVADQIRAWHLTFSLDAVRSEHSHEPGTCGCSLMVATSRTVRQSSGSPQMVKRPSCSTVLTGPDVTG